MNRFRVLHMYADVLDLYGDRGNIAALRYRSEQRGIEFALETCSIGERADLTGVDLVFIGGGADHEQSIVATDLLRRKSQFEEAVSKGVSFLLICGAYQLWGSHYIDASNRRLEGLGIGDYYTVSDGKNRCIGNVLMEVNLDGKAVEVIGFENHGGQTKGVATPAGRVIRGHGNLFSAHPESEEPRRFEGYAEDGVFGTYLHGPLLPKNPILADYFIAKALGMRLQELDDSLEQRAFETMKQRILKR